MRWVTFYYSILGGISDVTYHKTREDCRRFFKAHYKSYFQLNSPFKVDVPCRYGYGHRAYYAMSAIAFKKNWLKGSESTNGNGERDRRGSSSGQPAQ